MRLLTSVILILFLTACSSVRVETDYSTKFSFDTLSTFAIVHQERNGDDTLTNTRIIHALKDDLASKGYQAVDRDTASYYVLFHTDVRSKTRIDTDYRSVGMYPYAYGYRSMMVPTTRVTSYDEAKLIVDVVDPTDNMIIWRGIATDRLRSHETPQERTSYIDEVITALLKTFPERAVRR